MTDRHTVRIMKTVKDSLLLTSPTCGAPRGRQQSCGYERCHFLSPSGPPTPIALAPTPACKALTSSILWVVRNHLKEELIVNSIETALLLNNSLN